jgi:ribosomal protein S18 acetylase RimI-like enzyme
MSREQHPSDIIPVPGAPRIPGLRFRRFRGDTDYPAMAAVIEGSKVEDGIERTDSPEDVARYYQHLTNCDPAQDMLFVEVNGQVAGYSRVWWHREPDGKRLYPHLAFLLPAWREKGIRRSMLQHNEHRLREIAAGHPPEAPKHLESWAADTEVNWESLLVRAGYKAIRYGFDMVRPTLEEIPELPLPPGIEVQSVTPEQYRAVWEAAKEAFRDEWEYTEDTWTDVQYEGWLKERTFTPDLWQVAWDGSQVAGMVLNFINKAENQEYGRRRGYTETICVRRPWRRQGLARALIARSLRLLKDLGMTEAALGVDAQNPSGALELYEGMGFRAVRRVTSYRKPMDSAQSQ